MSARQKEPQIYDLSLNHQFAISADTLLELSALVTSFSTWCLNSAEEYNRVLRE